MIQPSFTVRVDPEEKVQFNNLCEKFGMSANTAFNIFVKAVIRSRSIPFTIAADQNSADNFGAMFAERSAQMSSETCAEMTLDEINAEIKAARALRKK